MPCLAAAPVDHHLPGSTEDERGHAIGLANLPAAQALESHEKNVLGEIRGSGRVAQMLESIEPHARSETTIQLALGVTVPAGRGCADAARERGLVRTCGLLGRRVGHRLSIKGPNEL